MMISVKENSDIAHIITGIIFSIQYRRVLSGGLKNLRLKKTNHHHPIKKTIRTFKRKKHFPFYFIV